MRAGVRRAGIVVLASACLAALGAQTAGAGTQLTPKPGTYAGAGAMIGESGHGMQIGFTFKGGTVEVVILGYTFPGCSGFTSVPDAAIGPNRFQTSITGANNEFNRLKGRWVKPGMVRGKLVLKRPDDASCGNPGTYRYTYQAKRYGKP